MKKLPGVLAFLVLLSASAFGDVKDGDVYRGPDGTNYRADLTFKPIFNAYEVRWTNMTTDQTSSNPATGTPGTNGGVSDSGTVWLPGSSNFGSVKNGRAYAHTSAGEDGEWGTPDDEKQRMKKMPKEAPTPGPFILGDEDGVTNPAEPSPRWWTTGWRGLP